jgi:hypothetical protein
MAVITTTGLDKASRQQVQNTVEAAGGTYSAALHKGCTHLIASTRLTEATDKLAVAAGNAARWKLNVVTPAWWCDSMQQGKLLPEQPYKHPMQPVSSLLAAAQQVACCNTHRHRCVPAGHGRHCWSSASECRPPQRHATAAGALARPLFTDPCGWRCVPSTPCCHKHSSNRACCSSRTGHKHQPAAAGSHRSHPWRSGGQPTAGRCAAAGHTQAQQHSGQPDNQQQAAAAEHAWCSKRHRQHCTGWRQQQQSSWVTSSSSSSCGWWWRGRSSPHRGDAAEHRHHAAAGAAQQQPLPAAQQHARVQPAAGRQHRPGCSKHQAA